MKFWPMTAAKIMPELDLTSVDLPARVATIDNMLDEKESSFPISFWNFKSTK